MTGSDNSPGGPSAIDKAIADYMTRGPLDDAARAKREAIVAKLKKQRRFGQPRPVDDAGLDGAER